ncbi:MAG: hypothetical protein QM811_13365 [Pirellulales bacterium]
MVRITLASGMLGEFQNQQQPTPLVDETGNVLGVFVPTGTTIPSIFDTAELDRRIAEETGRPLREIFADLDGRLPK